MKEEWLEPGAHIILSQIELPWHNLQFEAFANFANFATMLHSSSRVH